MAVLMKYTFTFLIVILTGSNCSGTPDENVGELHVHGNSISVQNQDPVYLEKLFRKVYSIVKHTNAYKQYTFEEMKAKMINLTTWDAPSELKAVFPYYLAGFDYDQRPVWVLEAGKLDFRRVVEPGEESLATAKRYLFQAIFNIIRSFLEADSGDKEVRKALVILDMEGFSLKQVNSAPTASVFLELLAKYWDLLIAIIDNIIVLNANYVTKVAYDIVRPVAGQLLERVDLYGSNKNTWVPRLIKLMPVEIIPPWYGGSENFKPLRVFG